MASADDDGPAVSPADLGPGSGVESSGSDLERERAATGAGGTLLTAATASEELVVRFQAGDERALETLWARYLPRLKRWAHRRLPAQSRNDANTDDLVQEAFVRSVGRLRTFTPHGPQGLPSFFKTILLNQIRDHARRSRRRPKQEALDRVEADQHPGGDPSPLEQVLGRETLDRYERALASLSEGDQEIVLAFVELGCSDREIAELFAKPSADAARMARGRALARLARLMAATVRRAAP